VETRKEGRRLELLHGMARAPALARYGPCASHLVRLFYRTRCPSKISSSAAFVFNCCNY
jgi:hypothetical protein